MKANSKLVEMKSLLGALKSMLCFCERRKKKEKEPRHLFGKRRCSYHVTVERFFVCSSPPSYTDRSAEFACEAITFLCDPNEVFVWNGVGVGRRAVRDRSSLCFLPSSSFYFWTLFFLIPRLQTRRLLHIVLNANIIKNNDNKKELRIE